MILEVSDISVQEIRDSLTAVWEELLNKNNCSRLATESRDSSFTLEIIFFFFFNWLECPHILKYNARALGEQQKKEKRKNAWLAHRSTMDFIVTCGVHQRGSWHVRTSFPTRKIPERKNLCLKRSSPVNQETEISQCALLPWAMHFQVPFPFPFPPFTLYKRVSTSFWAGKNLFPCSRAGEPGRFSLPCLRNNHKL